MNISRKHKTLGFNSPAIPMQLDLFMRDRPVIITGQSATESSEDR